jgi:nucleoside 2-deoxyribosyltransferase
MQNKFVLSLLVACLSISVGHAEPQKKLKIYMAAGLFNARENHFNLVMTKKMEEKGYLTILPLREGFEDKYFESAAKEYMTRDEIIKSERELVYLRDIGIFIPESDIVLANLDEPLDDGVIVEMTYAHFFGKPVIGYRTDIRNTFSGTDGISGIHSFVAMQCDYLITEYLPGSSDERLNMAINMLAGKIDDVIQKKLSHKNSTLPNYALVNPQVASIVSVAKLVIGNPREMHTKNGVKDTVDRLIANQDKMRFVPLTE